MNADNSRPTHYTKIAQLRTAEQFRAYLDLQGIRLPFDAELQAGADAPLAQPYTLETRAGARRIGNRFAVLPMEGWDGTPDGHPSELTARRWENFGRAGAKLIWGGEAVAVRHDGRANPLQLMLNAATANSLRDLRERLLAAHAAQGFTTDDLYIGLQLTHSGRYARPNSKTQLEPRIAYHHPILDARAGVTNDSALLSDADLYMLIEEFIGASVLAQQIGFDFVDIKHCHGYLGHELLSAVDRPGEFGGSFENRTRFLRLIAEGIRARAPGLEIGVRLSAFDFVPFRADSETGVGQPVPLATNDGGYRYAFGGDRSGLGADLTDPARFLDLLRALDIRLVCLTAGSPYYNPHIQRPAMFPPSDGYKPPEDPLAGVARQIEVTRVLKASHPDLLIVGSAYSYLQDWLPNVAQAVVREGGADMIGLGRMMLSYPDLPADVLAGRPLKRKQICRTFSDCTTAPRKGMVSGCYPLDPFYKTRPEAERLAAMKAAE